MENTLTVSVLCQNDSILEKYTSVATKMASDMEFQSKLNLCEDDVAVYNLYKTYDYTDLSFEDFIQQFKESVSRITEIQPKGTFELTQEELECIVGGINFYKYFTALISAIPVSGPFLAGVNKAFSMGVQGQAIGGIIKQMLFGRPAVVTVGLNK